MILNFKHFSEAVRNVDEKLFEIPIHVLMSIIIVVTMFFYTMLDYYMQKFGTTEDINLKMISRIKKSFVICCLLLYLSCVIPLFWKRFEVNLTKVLDMRKNITFQTRTFCMMNQEEKICQRYQAEISCFEQIPYSFEVQGRMDEKSCSVIFPPGYSVYIEEFILDDPGPDNFVLLDEKLLEYSSKVK